MAGNDDVLAANRAFYGAFAASDYAAMDAIWASEAPVACVHPGWPALRGREAVMKSWARILAHPSPPKIAFGDAAVQSLGDLAIVVCREIVDGRPLVATNVFVREDGRWKIVHHHSGALAQTSGKTAPASAQRLH